MSTTAGATHSVAARLPTLEQLAAACSPQDTDIVFVSGSRLEGFGNTRSDYDVYVIQRGEYSGTPFVTVVLDGQYAVYETFSYAHALRVAETLNAIDVANLAAVWHLSWFELEFYYRVLIGRALAGEPAFVELKHQFRKEVIDRCVHAWCGVRAGLHLEEARRKLAIGKERGGYMAAQRAAAAAVDAFLAANGESYPGFKWRFEKLQRRFGATHDVSRRAWDLKALGTRGIRAYVAEVTAFCQELGMSRFESWSLGDVAYRHVDTATVVTVRNVAYLVENRNVVYRLTDAGRVVWDWIDGATPRRELIRRAAADAIMTQPEVDAFLFALADHALIR